MKPTKFNNDPDSRANLAMLTGLDELPDTSKLGAISVRELNSLIAECGLQSMAAFLRSKGTNREARATNSSFARQGVDGLAGQWQLERCRVIMVLFHIVVVHFLLIQICWNHISSASVLVKRRARHRKCLTKLGIWSPDQWRIGLASRRQLRQPDTT